LRHLEVEPRAQLRLEEPVEGLGGRRVSSSTL
jgi:hypothetical protein